MPEDGEEFSTAQVVHNWSMTIMHGSFCDLAVALALVERDLAEKTIQRIEVNVVAQLAPVREQFQAKGWSLEPLRQIATNFRNMTMEARDKIAKASKPN